MSAMIITEYTYVFDDVQFGIDLRSKRLEKKLSQTTVAKAVGWETSSSVSALENGRYADVLLLRDFVKLCQIFDLHPFDYYDLQRVETVDLFKILG